MRLLTNLLFEPKGMHNQNAAYNIKDTVMSGDGSKVYFAIQDVPAGIPLNDSNYWKLQIDLSGSKSAMDQALASFGNYAKVIGTRVKGEAAKASGNPVTFLPDAGSLLQPVTVLDVQQEGSGEPSPENIRPFIGYDALGLNAVGKNLCPGYKIGAYVNSNGAYDESYANYKCTELIPVFDVGWLIESNGANIEIESVHCFDIKQSWLGKSSINDRLPGTAYIAINYYARTLDLGWVQLELGSEPTPYAPYQGKLHTVQIGQTVYGGKFDWLTGKGLIEWTAVNLSHESVWSSISTIGDYTRAILYGVLKDAAGPEVALTADGLCSHVEYVTDWSKQSAHVYAYDRSVVATLPTSLVGTTSESINAWIAGQENAGTPVQIAYKRATPIEIQLTPHIISAVDPEQTNTLYGDGRVDVTYVKPLHVSIEERVAAALAAAMNTEGE